ncbi:hypothetical protein C2G38_2219961 [Gigaspora rosea]|uniref:Uncharacterized protein n=1 Tax=Gigaspora rosea TaxID=44941 RepID=A0A397U4V9_9GLOM|nr:hypothetical protein C2G38_2219961 [Gigaspora rosea]
MNPSKKLQLVQKESKKSFGTENESQNIQSLQDGLSQKKLNCADGYCLFNNDNNKNKVHPATGSEYPIAFLIIKFKQSVTLKAWLDFLKEKNSEWNPVIFMVNDADEFEKLQEELVAIATE